MTEFGPSISRRADSASTKPGRGRERFGPPGWEGDALVSGFSRKLWRVALAKTSTGYVGRPVLLASFRSLAVDVALAEGRDIVVACHGGSRTGAQAQRLTESCGSSPGPGRRPPSR